MDAWAAGMPGAEWQPRVNGCSRAIQRSIRQAVAGDLGVPAQWTAVCGRGLPQWWLRLAFPWTWRWRLTRTGRPMRLHIYATTVCCVVTRRWSYALRLQVRQRYQAHRDEWDEGTSEAWSLAEHDGHHRKPRSFGFRGEGPSIHPSEGQGGAPITYLLRSSTLKWEVLAASNNKCWLRITGTVPMADLDEAAWASDGMSRRDERREARQRERARRAQLPGYWVTLYWARFNKRILEGASEEEAHAAEREAFGPGWTRQEGDNNDYGTPGCPVCTVDGHCAMCAFAHSRETTAEELVRTDEEWMDSEDTSAWGPPDLELWYFMKQGLLDSVWDPDAVAEAVEAQVAGAGEAGAEEAGSASGDVQSEGGGQTDERMSEGAGEFVVLEDSAQEGAAEVYSGLVEAGSGMEDEEEGDLESDGASWHMVRRHP